MSLKSKFNPYRIPFSPTVAQEHRSATSTGVPSQTNNRCACCLQPIQKVALPINFNQQNLNHLNIEYKYLYKYLKIIGIFIFLILFDSGITQFQDIVGSNTQTLTISSKNWSSLAPNYSSDKFWLYSLLSFVSIGFFMFFVRVYMTYKIKTQNNLRQGQQSFSILLRNIPKSTNIEEKIRDLFKVNFDNIRIRQIIIISSMEEYKQAKQQIMKQVNQWRKLLGVKQKKKEDILATLKKIQSSTKKFNQVKQKVSEQTNQNFSGNAIVVFQSKQNRNQILKAWNDKFLTKNKLQASFGDSNLKQKQLIFAEEAPLPEQIYWENISCPYPENQASKRLNYILSFLVFVGFYLFYLLSQIVIGRKIGQKISEIRETVIITLILLSILSYSVLPYIIELLQKRQKSISKFQSSKQKFLKYSLILLSLRSVLLFAVQTTFNPNNYLAYSTINTMILFILVDLVISTLFWLINPFDLIKRVQKVFFSKRNSLTQQQANHIFQRPSHNTPFKYAFMLCAFWTSVMYVNLAPVIIIVELLSIFTFFWIDKINLAKRSSVSNKRISSNFVKDFISMMEIGLILKPLANLVLWSMAKQSVAIPQIIMLVSGIIYNVFSKQKLVQKVLKNIKYEEKAFQSEYNQAAMTTLYRIENPITGSLQQKIDFLQNIKGVKININEQCSQISVVSNSNNCNFNTIQDKVQLDSRPQVNGQMNMQGNQNMDNVEKVQNVENYPGNQLQNGEYVDTDRNMVIQ